MLSVRTFVNNPVTSNCYLFYDKGRSKDCIIIDPGSRNEDVIFDFISQEDLKPILIILTHEHFDHCWGVNQLVEEYHIPIVCSDLCASAIKNVKRNCSLFYDNKEAFTINCEVVSVESLSNVMKLGGYSIQFYHTPGHTDASISFVIGNYLLTGDTLIKDERTVTKLPTGSTDRLNESIELYEKMKGRGLLVCPGHGEMFELDGYDLPKMTR
jgi:glyoxylase-like metal-dependent hydrolase (beta-lactamase superfamily II)